MKKLWALFLIISFLLVSCISISSQPDLTPPAQQFVTATLPPTKSLVLPPTTVPSVVGATLTPTLSVTEPADCKVQAVLLEDVTIPDGTLVPAGDSFTKTWRFMNSGTCHWTGYTINFLTGDRMGAPESAPIPDTLADSTVDVSMDLVAPTANGNYSAYFTIKNTDGDSIKIGTEKTFWLKITVGSGTPEPDSTPDEISTDPVDETVQCVFKENAAYINQIQNLINQERGNKNLPSLSVDKRLSSAAQNHAEDMACNDFRSHTGSDGSYVNDRIVAAGYSPSFSEEIIFAGGGPQDAFDWWMSDELHRNAILGKNSTEFGIGYAFSDSSTYGDYFAVEFASP